MIARFFSPAGRSSGARIALFVFAACLVGGAGMLAARGGSIIVVTLVGAAWGATAAKLAAEVARRRHDRGVRGRGTLAGMFVTAVAGMVCYVVVGPTIPFYIACAVAAGVVGWLVLASGTPRDNAYGAPPPNAFRPSASPPARTALAGAMLLTLAGAAAGLMLAGWADALARRHAANGRSLADHAPAPDPFANDAAAQRLERPDPVR